MMYATLAVQAAAAIAMMAMLPVPAPTTDGRRAAIVLDTPMPTEAPKLRCRLYFGCAPQPKVADALHP